MPGQSGRIAIVDLRKKTKTSELAIRDLQDRFVTLNNRVLNVERILARILEVYIEKRNVAEEKQSSNTSVTESANVEGLTVPILVEDGDESGD